ncbi:MAG: SDR family oxidoreductase [Gemmataceae bacterium]
MLHGKKTLITGSLSGIGLAVAQSFAKHGAFVVLTSEKPWNSEKNVEQLKWGKNCVYIEADLKKEGEAERLVAKTWEKLGGIDILVNNIGQFREPSFFELTQSHFHDSFGFNVWASLAITQDVVRRAVAAGKGGRILFSSSLNGTRSEPGHTLYDASKGAINALTRQLAVELAPYGWTTAAVAPGLVETPLTDFGLRSDPVARQQIIDQIPLRKIATVEDVAEWYAFLASDAACYATGIVVPVCGGLDAQQMSLRPMAAAERHGS